MSSDDKPVVRSPAATKLLPKFISHRERDVTTIRQALDKGDFETIARLGHNMRGNGRGYGFPDIGDIGERMEIAANTRSAPGVQAQLAALEAWLIKIGPVPASEDPPSRPESAMRVRAASADADPPDPGKRTR